MTPSDLVQLRVSAAEVMGCKQYKRPHDGKVFLCLEDPSKGLATPWMVVDEPIDKFNSDVPDTTEDLNAANALCVIVQNEGWNWRIDSWGPGKVRCTFYKGLKTDAHSVTGPPALAITLAALRAMGKGEEKTEG